MTTPRQEAMKHYNQLPHIKAQKREYSRWYYRAQREKVMRYREKNHEKLLTDKRTWNRLNKEKRLSWHLWTKYGVTAEWMDDTLKSQNYGCAICDEPPTPGHRLHVDHDHETGRARGLLCRACNAGLGWFRDNAARAMKAAAYLERHQS